MAAPITFYLSNTDISAGVLETLATSAPSSLDSAQGWTVDKKASPNFCVYVPDATQAASAFVTTEPSAFSQKGYRTSATKNGRFASGNWVLSFKVLNNSYYAQTGQVKFRLWKSTAADGAGATQITPGWQASSTITFTAGAQQKTGSITWAAGATVDLNNEYLFLEIEWSAIASGGNNSAIVYWCHNEGAAEQLVTPNYADFTLLASVINAAGSTGGDWPGGVPVDFVWDFAGNLNEKNGLANLTQSGTLAFTTDKWGRASQAVLRDNGSNTGYGYVDGITAMANPGAQFSVLVDCKPNANDILILGLPTAETNTWYLSIGGYSSYDFTLTTKSAGNQVDKSSTSNLFSNAAVTRAIMTFDNGTVSFYKNGVLDSAPTGGQTPGNNTSNPRFLLPDHQYNFDGQIDVVAFYQGVWSQTHVTALQNGWAPGTPLLVTRKIAGAITAAALVPDTEINVTSAFKAIAGLIQAAGLINNRPLSVTRKVVGLAQAAATTPNALLKLNRQIIGVSTGAANLPNLTLKATRRLAGQSQAAANLPNALLKLTRRLAAIAAGQALTQADLHILGAGAVVGIAGSLSGQGGLAGILNLIRALQGQSASQVSISANLSMQQWLMGIIQAQGHVLGNLQDYTEVHLSLPKRVPKNWRDSFKVHLKITK